MPHVDSYALRGAALPGTLRVLAFHGREELSAPFRFEVFASMPHAAHDDATFDAVIGSRATLEILGADGATRRRWHGAICEASLEHELGGAAVVRLVLVPRLWFLSLSERSRVFVGDALPAVLEKSLREGGLRDVAFRLQRSYRPLEHVCQYRESHLAFVSRWMEREGLYFHFEHGDEAETLVITDARPYAPAAEGPLRFAASADVRSGLEAVTALSVRRRAAPGDVLLRDFDPALPTMDVSGAAPVDRRGHGEVRRFGEHFHTSQDGRRLAGVRAQEIAATQKVYEGRATVRSLQAGHGFALVDHPRATLDRGYVAVSVEHRGYDIAGVPEARALLGLPAGDERAYEATFSALEDSVQFRAPSRTPWPRVYGVESGTVDGPAASEYAQLDDHGRYKVKLRFDESDLDGGRASTWVRMIQPHAGSPEGAHFPLRKGTEVMLVFLGGDPDQPVIAGAAPNASTPSPVTDANATMNILLTGGENRLAFEDLAGAQYAELSSPTESTFVSLGAVHGRATHNNVSSTDGTGLIHTGGGHDRTVGGAMTEDVIGSVTETYHATQTTTVNGHWTETLAAGGTQTITGGLAQTIQGGRAQSITGGDAVVVNGGRTSTVNGGEISMVDGARTGTVNGACTATVNGATTATVNGAVNVTISSGLNITSPAGVFIHAPAGYTCVAPGGVTILAPTTHHELHSEWMKCAAESSDWAASKIGGTGLQFEAVGVGVSVKGVSVEAVGASIGFAAFKLDSGAIHSDERSLKIGTHALKFEVAALHVKA